MKRKTFIKNAAVIAGLSAALPKFSLAESSKQGSEKIKIGIVGVGSRGSGALRDMYTACQNIEVVSIAELYPERIEAAKQSLTKKLSALFPNFKIDDYIKATPETTFFGLDSIDKLLKTDCDVVVLATPPVFRPSQIEKCIKANKHVFAEKPVCIDATGYHKIIDELIPEADKRGLKVLCGTQMRYHSSLQDAIDKIHNGEIGDISYIRCLRLEGEYLRGWYKMPENLKPENVEYQIRNWLAFDWTSGDQPVEQFVHNLDLALWALNKFPTEVVALGQRSEGLKFPLDGNRFTTFSGYFDFDDGVGMSAACRQDDATSRFSELRVCGTKGPAYLTFRKQQIIKNGKTWVSEESNPNPLTAEHMALFKAIRNDEKFNTLKNCADSCLAGIILRESAYSGKRFKTAWIKDRSKQNYMPESLSLDGIKEVNPIPIPGRYKLV